jgi:hypothetical protein
MKKTIVTIAAVLMTAGAALAESKAQDAAPASVVVKQPSMMEYSSDAAVTAPAGATNQQERALIIQNRADNR